MEAEQGEGGVGGGGEGGVGGGEGGFRLNHSLSVTLFCKASKCTAKQRLKLSSRISKRSA